MSRSISTFTAFATFVALVSSPASAQEVSMLGRWFTEGVEKGVHLQVFLENKADGTYVKDVRAIMNCETAGSGKETGKWTFEHGEYATASELVDGKPVTGSYADTHDLFKVTRVDGMHVSLLDTETDITWALSLVPDSFSFPPARGCSI